jgi:hypothetical protein
MRLLAWLLIAVGVADLFALRGDSASPEDPPTWIFVALAVGGVCLAACALALARERRTIVAPAVLLLMTSATSLVSFWVLAILFAG